MLEYSFHNRVKCSLFWLEISLVDLLRSKMTNTHYLDPRFWFLEIPDTRGDGRAVARINCTSPSSHRPYRHSPRDSVGGSFIHRSRAGVPRSTSDVLSCTLFVRMSPSWPLLHPRPSLLLPSQRLLSSTDFSTTKVVRSVTHPCSWLSARPPTPHSLLRLQFQRVRWYLPRLPVDL